MANFFPIVLFLSLFISLHVQARESQFFSKFTANSDAKTEPTVTTRVGPSKEQAESLEKQAQDPPSFVAETGNAFGLYGHETGQLPPSDTAVSASAATTSFADEPYYNKEKNYDGSYKKDVFATEDEIAADTKAMLQGSGYATAAEDSFDSAAVNGRNNYFPDARLQGGRYTTGAATEGNYGNVVANGRNNYYAVGNRYAANDNNVQRQQGMSDTRFLENGKYYYNVDDSRNDANSYEFGARNGNSGNHYTDNYAAGGYEPFKDMDEFRARKNDDEFMP